ncbi:MAG: nascent polypeptide-associated complex protein [Candidatus Lokiarchaeota archaeon]
MKLPKEIKKREKSHPRRPSQVKKGHSQFGSRQMRRRMQQQGIDMDQIDSTRVIIESPEKTLVINQPEVVLMKQMGQEIYQVIGEAEEYAPGEFTVGEESPKDNLDQEVEEFEEEEEVRPTITETDIMLVASQANVDKAEAEAVLREHNGDIAKAIVYLKNR